MTTKAIRFTKMHGAGNDYVYIDCHAQVVEQPEALARLMSDRHTGVGGDGLVLIMPSETCDLRMRIFNADGSEAEMCGNASRCIGKYAYEHKLTDKLHLTLETRSGVKHLWLHVNDRQQVSSVTVDMGAADVIRHPANGRPMIRQCIEAGDFQTCMTAVSMGNPHCVCFVPSLGSVDVQHVGPLLEHHSLFPNRTNVEFAELITDTEIRMRVWERGSGETLACGTGACATAVAAVLNGLCPPDADIRLHLPGGTLTVNWHQQENHVLMSGPAQEIFSGEMLITPAMINTRQSTPA